MVGQGGQHGELRSSQRQLLTGPSGHPGLFVDHEIGHRHHARLLPTAAAQQRTNPRHQLGQQEGLHHVIVPADGEPGEAVDLLVGGGEEDHRQIAAITHEPAERQSLVVGLR